MESDNEEALHENPDLEICIPRENILKNLKQNRKSYDDNETLEQKERLKNATKTEKSSNQSKRDLYAKWPAADGYSARMVDQIELEEEEIVEEVNKESALEEAGKHQVDDIYYLDGNNSLSSEGSNQTNGSSSSTEEFKLNNKQNEQQKFHLDQQRQEANFHFSEDDENDNEEGDSDLDQVISTTTITSLNYAVNKQQHLDKKQ